MPIWYETGTFSVVLQEFNCKPTPDGIAVDHNPAGVFADFGVFFQNYYLSSFNIR